MSAAADSAAKPKARRARVPTPNIRQQKLEKTRAAILEAALDQFAIHGFEGASIRDIAAKAGVNHGMIRHIYGGKDELWRQALIFLFERARAELDTGFPPPGMTVREAFVERLRRYVNYCARHPEHARIMIQQSIMAGPELTWAAEELIRARHTFYAPLYERAIAAGALPHVDLVYMIFSITASCQMLYVLAPEVKALTGRDVFQPEEIDRHVDALAKIFLR